MNPEEPSDLSLPSVTPLDVVKVRLQAQRPSVAGGEVLRQPGGGRRPGAPLGPEGLSSRSRGAPVFQGWRLPRDSGASPMPTVSVCVVHLGRECPPRTASQSFVVQVGTPGGLHWPSRDGGPLLQHPLCSHLQGSACCTAVVSWSRCTCAQMAPAVPPGFRILPASLAPW